jgi:KamA family protein
MSNEPPKEDITIESVDLDPSDDDVPLRVPQTRQGQLVSVEQVRERLESFLEHCFDYPLAGPEFTGIIVGDTGTERLASLLVRCGHPGDHAGFIRSLITRLGAMNHTNAEPVTMNGLTLPRALLLSVLEVLIPDGGFKQVKKVRQLENLANLQVPASNREPLQRVLDLYPVRLSLHTIRQMRISSMVARQYFPFVEELDPEGEMHTWVGQFFRGIVEQMYQNRVIFVMNMTCPVYCRFCFRKHKECRAQRTPKKEHVKQALAYIQTADQVKEVVLTGGDPFMNRATLQFAVTELGKVAHVQTLRLASRAVSYYPEMFLRDNAYWLNYLLRANMELQLKGKRIELATHFLHPDEISYDALDVITQLTRNGVPVYVQTPLMAHCNDNGSELVALFNILRAAGAELHYIFMPTSTIRGNRDYWSPISQGLAVGRYLRAHLSDRAVPHLTTATEIGKVDWNSSGWAVERRSDDQRFIWIRTPYTRDYYETFAPIMQISPKVRENSEGTLDAAFYAEIGDEKLFTGPRGLTSSPEAHQYRMKRTAATSANFLEQLQDRFLQDQRRLDLRIDQRPVAALARDHFCRAELDCGSPGIELAAALDYLAGQPQVTDLVLSRADDVFSGLSRTVGLLSRLGSIGHLRSIRLRSLKLNYAPSALPRAAVSRLAPFNRLQPVGPLRLELETQFIHSGEFRPEHAQLVGQLRRHGIAVYNNTPLLGEINDNGEEMLRISSGCREAGIEFNSVYVAGLPVQREWNRERPIELNTVIDIATVVRRQGSGREIPRYLVRTDLGEVDFSITPRIFEYAGDEVRVRLLERPLDYFRSIDPAFEWPEMVVADHSGDPLVPIDGLRLESQDFICPPPDGPAH